MTKRRTFLAVLLGLIVALCLVGTAVMLFISFGAGLSMWFVSLVAGALLLYVRHTLEKKLRDLEEEEARG